MKHNKRVLWFTSLVALTVLLSTGNGVNGQEPQGHPLFSKEQQEQARNAAPQIIWGDRKTDSSIVKVKNAPPQSPPCPKIAAGNLVVNSSGDHVFFIGTDKRVYNYWWNINKYQLDWLGPKQIAVGNPVVNASGDHVFFIGTDQRVYNYWWNINKYQLDWLGPKQIAAGNLVLNSSADHVFFIGTDQRVYNYWWNGTWHLDWLGPKQIAAGNLVVNSSADHVFFIGTDKREYNYWWDGTWHLDALCT